MTFPHHRIETRLIHAGEMRPRIQGAVSMPVFQSSTFECSGEGDHFDVRYIRLNNTPNHEVLHGKLASLESGEAALVTSSGMAAIATTLLTLLGKGDHLLAQKGLYGGTHDFLQRDFASFSLSHDFVEGDNPESWEEKLRPETRAFYVETLTNPLMEVADLEGILEFSRGHNLVTVIDNTFASPVNFRPLELGFDLSLHSGTKYLNGHSDIVAGAIIGKRHLVERISHRLRHLGGSLDPHACFLLHRGLKTLALRVRYQNQSALEIARYLEQHPAVKRVNYPGLTCHPQHQRAARLLEGFSGMLSFELQGGLPAANHLLQTVELPIVAPSLGGVETLITRPATTSHSGMTADERRTLGISEALIRMSIGLEATTDLLQDLERALQT